MAKKRKFNLFFWKKKTKMNAAKKFLFSRNGIFTFAFAVLLGISIGVFTLTESYLHPQNTPPVLEPGIQGLGNVTPDRFETFDELELRVVERTEDFCDPNVGRIVTFAPERPMTVQQILNQVILDVELNNPFVWITVKNEYDDTIDSGRPGVDPTLPVFQTSFYYQHFDGVKDFIEADGIVYKGQMIVFQFKKPVEFCVPEFNLQNRVLISGSGWTVGPFFDENFIHPDFQEGENELEVEHLFKTELINNVRFDLGVQEFEPGFYWVKTKYVNSVE